MRHLITLVEEPAGQRHWVPLAQRRSDRHDLCFRRADVQHLLGMAQFERRLIQERTKAGLGHRATRGRNGGRPKVAAEETKVVLAKKTTRRQERGNRRRLPDAEDLASTFYRYSRGCDRVCRFPVVS